MTMTRPTRRERRLRQKYEQPGDLTVLIQGVKIWSINIFYFMFSWYFFLSNKLEERRERKRSAGDIESFDELMESASEPSVEESRFAQIASQMRGDDSHIEREIYIEFRFREIVTMVLSIILTLAVCAAIAGAIVGVFSLAHSLIFS